MAGAPIFALLGGAAAIMFLSESVPGSAILIQTYQLSTKPTLASIPLFTLVGVLLAEGGAPQRLLRVFRALFGWFPGGTAVVCAMLCAFFTVFTGGSGVTILALGGLLFPALVKDGYGEKFSLGLLTASGSLGLLLPPALPLILYGIVAQSPIEDLFIGGILPGVLLIGMTSAWGIRAAITRKVHRPPFAVSRGRRGAVGRQVGDRAAGGDRRRALQRVRHHGGSRGDRRALRVLHPGVRPPRPEDRPATWAAWRPSARRRSAACC